MSYIVIFVTRGNATTYGTIRVRSIRSLCECDSASTMRKHEFTVVYKIFGLIVLFKMLNISGNSASMQHGICRYCVTGALYLRLPSAEANALVDSLRKVAVLSFAQ